MAQTAVIELMVMSGPDDGTLLKLMEPRSPEGYLIGRREDCDVILPFDSQISRNHARLYHGDEGWFVEDLGSKNGTFIGKQRLEGSRALEPGQMFRMGRTWLRLQAASIMAESVPTLVVPADAVAQGAVEGDVLPSVPTQLAQEVDLVPSDLEQAPNDGLPMSDPNTDQPNIEGGA